MFFGFGAVCILADNCWDNCWCRYCFFSYVLLPQGKENILIGRNFKLGNNIHYLLTCLPSNTALNFLLLISWVCCRAVIYNHDVTNIKSPFQDMWSIFKTASELPSFGHQYNHNSVLSPPNLKGIDSFFRWYQILQKIKHPTNATIVHEDHPKWVSKYADITHMITSLICEEGAYKLQALVFILILEGGRQFFIASWVYDGYDSNDRWLAIKIFFSLRLCGCVLKGSSTFTRVSLVKIFLTAKVRMHTLLCTFIKRKY